MIVCDGSPPTGGIEAAKRTLPSVLISELSGLLAKHGPTPTYLNAVSAHPLSKKLRLLFALQAERDILYADSDVLALNYPDELAAHLGGPAVIYIPETIKLTSSEELQSRSDSLGLKHDPRLNSGMLYLPRNSLDPIVLEKLFSGWYPPLTDWFVEQWAIAVAVANYPVPAIALPVDRYVITNARQFWHFPDIDYRFVACRHFVTPVRHVLYLKGLPHLRREAARIRDELTLSSNILVPSRS